MSSYYNEIDSYAAQWLRNLIAAGHIAPGIVDERSIEDVRPDELREYTQCHFFAGIGVWSYALRSAGWPDDRPVWTGSCPCQGFSQAGKGAGFADERHLWPAWFHLIRERRPAVVFGEQVSAAIRHGWLDLVLADMEGEGYACGHAVFGAHSVGAPHIRQRLLFVADAGGDGVRRGHEYRSDAGSPREVPREVREQRVRSDVSADSAIRELADTADDGQQRRWASEASDGRVEARLESQRFRSARDVGDADNARLEGRELSAERAGERAARSSGLAGHWAGAEWIRCQDGKLRAVEPGTFPLAHGAAARVGRLRAYGNAIVAPAAEAFIRAFMGARP